MTWQLTPPRSTAYYYLGRYAARRTRLSRSYASDGTRPCGRPHRQVMRLLVVAATFWMTPEGKYRKIVENRRKQVARMEHVQLTRRLTAVLLADVVGYSRLMSVDEEGTHIRLGDCIKHLIEPTVCAYRGRLARSKGDGLLAEFDSAVDAVRGAVDIQHRLADAAADSNDKLELRIGINSGDVFVDEHDVYGNSVNIASRLEGLAEPGGIYITGAVREQLLGHPGLWFQDLGERRVKNIDRPIRVYRVIGQQEEDSTNSSGPRVLARLFARRAFHFGHRATIMSVGVLAGI